MPSINIMKQRSLRLEKDITKWENIITSSPSGNLIARKRRNDQYQYYYWLENASSDKKEIYIPQKNLDFAAQLAMREYAKYRLADAKKKNRCLIIS